jgi:hypothetical protein
MNNKRKIKKKRDYAKEQLREYTGQCKSKERDFKEQKEDFRSEV